MVPVRALAIILVIVVLVGGWGSAFVMWRAAEVGELVGPVPVREFETLTLVNVGTGGRYENPERLGPSTAIGLGREIVLVDAGRGLSPALRTARIPVVQPSTILLTHLMPDNLLGLGDLLYTGALQGREEPLLVIGPRGTLEAVAGIEAGLSRGLASLQKALALPPGGVRFEVIEAENGYETELSGMTVRAGALSDGPLPALAWRISASSRSVVVSGTGWGAEDLIAFSKGADLLVHDGAYIPPTETLEDAGVVADAERLEREAAISTPLLGVGDMAHRAGVPRLMLIRLQPPPFFDLQVRSIVSQTYDGRVLVPEDGDEFEF